jgi:cytidylate kinase
VDEHVGARRVWQDLQQSDARNEDEGLKTVEDVLSSHQARTKSDIERYKKYLGINPYDKSHFDFVLDTTHLTPDETFAKVWDFVQSRMN